MPVNPCGFGSCGAADEDGGSFGVAVGNSSRFSSSMCNSLRKGSGSKRRLQLTCTVQARVRQRACDMLLREHAATVIDAWLGV
jgi:hypothetical protein